MNTNWPMGVDRSHPNWTGTTPRTGYEGGSWSPDSTRIPKRAWLAVAAVLVLAMVAMHVGAALF